MFIIDHIRIAKFVDRTIGKVAIPGNSLIYTLEDTVRPYGVKIYGETCIPANKEGYKLRIHYSPKFKRDVICLYTEPDSITLKAGGISFKNIYIHGGNNPTHTYGCILVASEYNPTTNTIHKSCEQTMFAYIKDCLALYPEVRWRITEQID